MMKMGEAYTETEGQMYITSRYVDGKTEWIKWKRMLETVSKSDMKMSTLLEIGVYKIFKEGGLWDQGYTWEQKELMAMKNFIQYEKFWDFNMKMPEGCYYDNCPAIKAWFGPRGVSDDAASMMNFRVKDE
jgi:hypothetical protein